MHFIINCPKQLIPVSKAAALDKAPPSVVLYISDMIESNSTENKGHGKAEDGLPSRALVILMLLCVALGGLPSCTKDEVKAIRKATPTELPPITTSGENTMGAWVETDTGRVLFVASGVDRLSDPGDVQSIDCDPFQNWRYESQEYISITGRWCPRPEIGDDRSMWMQVLISDSGPLYASFIYDVRGGSTRWYESSKVGEDSDFNFTVTDHDTESRHLSGLFNGILFNKKAPFDTILIADGRFDTFYGSTP